MNSPPSAPAPTSVCVGTQHPNKASALAAARLLHYRKGRRYRAEKCPVGDHWHTYLRRSRYENSEHTRVTHKRRNLRSRNARDED